MNKISVRQLHHFHLLVRRPSVQSKVTGILKLASKKRVFQHNLHTTASYYGYQRHLLIFFEIHFFIIRKNLAHKTRLKTAKNVEKTINSF